MNKKRSIFVRGVWIPLMSILVLTGCGGNEGSAACNSRPVVREDVPFDGNDVFVTSDYASMTNQEMFDEMVATDGSIFSLLHLVDDIVLGNSFCVDQDEVDEFMSSIRDDIEDFDAFMLEEGFTSEDEIIKVVERNLLRQEAVRRNIVITDAEIEEAFEMWFADVEDVELDDMRDSIYDSLVEQHMGDMGSILAKLREEAGFVIYHEGIANAYEAYLRLFETDLQGSVEVENMDETTDTDNADLDTETGLDTDTDNIDVETESEIDTDTNNSDVDENIIARVGDEEITIGQLFEALVGDLGMLKTFELLDEMILQDQFEVEDEEVEDEIEALRERLGDDFDMVIAEQGFESEEELFEYYKIALLQEAAFNAAFAPSEARLRELHAQMGVTVSGSHILIGNEEAATPEEIAENEELAMELIERLQEADADDFADLFAELATEYSTCNSREVGGDLGSWERGRMVAEFEDAIFDMEVGEFTTEPVQTQFGLHIIYKTGTEDVPDFEDVRDELEAEELAMLRQTGAMASLLMDLRQEANIAFTSDVLQAQFEALAERASTEEALTE